ncbi:hypothetical protein [Kineococcus rubinsiae]|uniref:hypothetical protein n=1 Tax=Kineococcus rubinsiae TaxID=2609562 RepID=UPI0014315D09|nr:hypothetical protein [Kineococcus rubinsiae]NIZ91913.1 hypothetical protein [Kineococcus rubinsiae]
MTAADALRVEASRLREGARALRAGAEDLDTEVRGVAAHYPVPSPTLWSGPAADTFATGLTGARAALGAVARDVVAHAEHCEALAVARERQADQLELAARAAALAPS